MYVLAFNSLQGIDFLERFFEDATAVKEDEEEDQGGAADGDEGVDGGESSRKAVSTPFPKTCDVSGSMASFLAL